MIWYLDEVGIEPETHRISDLESRALPTAPRWQRNGSLDCIRRTTGHQMADADGLLCMRGGQILLKEAEFLLGGNRREAVVLRSLYVRQRQISVISREKEREMETREKNMIEENGVYRMALTGMVKRRHRRKTEEHDRREWRTSDGIDRYG